MSDGARAKHKVLLMAYLFPPAGGVGVQRALSFAKYLPQNDIELHVLSAWNPVVPTRDPSLLKQIPAGVTLHHAFTPELPFPVRQAIWKLMGGGGSANGTAAAAPAPPPREGFKSRLKNFARTVFSPDPEVVWVPFAVRAARRIIRRYGIQTVVITVPPFSSLLAAIRLKRLFPNVTVITDFRDEWFQFHLSIFDYHRNEAIISRARRIERTAAEMSDKVIAVVPGIADQMRRRYPDLDPAKFVCIPNGYDPAAFGRFQSRPHGTGRILITYAGTIYPPSTPRFLLDALDALPDEVRSRFLTRFIGRVTKEEESTFEGRKSAVELLGFLPQAEAFRRLEETDFLVLTMLDPLCATGKLLEYLATGKPILGITPENSEVARIIHLAHAGWTADPNDPQAIRDMLLRAREFVDSGKRIDIDPSVVAGYERPRLAAQLARLIRESAPATR